MRCELWPFRFAGSTARPARAWKLNRAKELTEPRISRQKRADCGRLHLRLIPRLCSAASGESLI
jgi:hypothetical protein